MSYGKLALYSIVPVATILIGIAIAQILCIAIGVIGEIAAVAAFVGMRRKEMEEKKAAAGPRRTDPGRRTA